MLRIENTLRFQQGVDMRQYLDLENPKVNNAGCKGYKKKFQDNNSLIRLFPLYKSFVIKSQWIAYQNKYETYYV